MIQELPTTCPNCRTETSEVKAADETIYCGRCYYDLATLPVELKNTTVRPFFARRDSHTADSRWKRDVGYGYGIDVYSDGVNTFDL